MFDFGAVNDAVAEVFGRAFTLRRGSTVIATGTGVFDSRHFEVLEGGEVPVSTLVTTIAIRDDEAADVRDGDLIAVPSLGATGNYIVRDVKPDAEGMKILFLEAA